MSTMTPYHNCDPAPRLDLTELRNRLLPPVAGILAVLAALVAAYAATPDNPAARLDAERSVPLRALNGGSLR